MNTHNPFKEFFNLEDAWKKTNVPTVDMKALFVAYEKNMNALGTSGKMAYDGMQEIAARQSENLRRNAQGWASAWDGAGTARTPEDVVFKSTDFIKSLYQSMLADIWDLNEISSKTTAKSWGAINKRVTDSLDEMKTLFSNGNGTNSAPSANPNPIAKKTEIVARH